jgi:heme/copper-type cytochrome/quinol oxidase subunit 3
MRQQARLGMALFLLSEAVFFFMLIAAFVYFRGATLPIAAANLKLGTTAVYTAALVASSFTMWRAASGGATRAWLVATIVLGSIFLLGQSSEYLRLFQRNITISQNLFGATFFTLTGFHGLHVLVGIVLLAALAALSAAGFESAHRIAVETVSLYWYFVDAVWIAIFSVVYLWSLL